MNRNSKRMLSIILSTCLVISMYHGEIIAIRPKEREDYVPEFCGIKENEDKKLKIDGSRVIVKRRRLG